jgi:hypothetical protein
MKVKVKLINRADDTIVFERIGEESASIVGEKGETMESAKAEVFDKISRWISFLLLQECW